jgi:hypothetical protein
MTVPEGTFRLPLQKVLVGRRKAGVWVGEEAENRQ